MGMRTFVAMRKSVASVAERLAEDLLREARRVDVRSVDQVDAGVARHGDLFFRPVDVDLADGLCPAGASEAHRAERDDRDAQAGAAELPVLHALIITDRDATTR